MAGATQARSCEGEPVHTHSRSTVAVEVVAVKNDRLSIELDEHLI
jgi:hypothetical protein